MWQGGNFTQYEQGDYVFSIRQMPPFVSIKVLGELQKIILPAFGGILKGVGNNPSADTKNAVDMASILSDGLEKLAFNLDGDKLEKAVQMLLDANYVAVKAKDGKEFVRLDEGAVNEVFSGRIIDMVVLAIQVFKINYLDFSKLSSVSTGVLKTLREVELPSFLAKSAKTSRT